MSGARRMGLILCSVAAMSGYALPSSASYGSVDLYEALGVRNIPAHYVILVDASVSMRGHLYDTAKAHVGRLLKGLDPADYVTVIAFATFPRLYAARKVGREQLPFLNYLPPVPGADPELGDYTDIGRALEKALTDIEETSLGEIVSVVMLTDGHHDLNPRVPSPYPEDFKGRWPALKARAERIASRTRGFRAYGLELTPAADATILMQVFPSATILALPKISIGGYLDKAKSGTRKKKALLALGDDLRPKIEVLPGDLARFDRATGGGRFTVKIVNRAKSLPLQVEDPSLSCEGLGIRFSGLPKTLSLPPDEQVPVPVQARWEPPTRAGPPRRDSRESCSLSLGGAIWSPWYNQIESLLDRSVQHRFGSARIEGYARVGWSWASVYAIAGALAVLIGVAMRMVNSYWPIRSETLVARRISDGASVRIGLNGIRRHSRVVFGRKLSAGGGGEGAVNLRFAGKRKVPVSVASPRRVIDGVEFELAGSTRGRGGHTS